MPPSSSATRNPDSTLSPSDDLIDEVAEPGFLAMPERTPDPQLEPIEATEGPSGWDGESDVAGDGPSGPTTSTEDRSPSSTGSTDLPGLEELARTLVGLASVLVRLVRARRRPDLPEGVWIADEDDQAAIGDPLARIAARHSPVGNGPTGDMVDGITMLVGTAAYVSKGIQVEALVDEAARQTPDLGAPE